MNSITKRSLLIPEWFSALLLLALGVSPALALEGMIGNHWDKMERPGVLIENGHVTAFTLAVLDVEKTWKGETTPTAAKLS